MFAAQCKDFQWESAPFVVRHPDLLMKASDKDVIMKRFFPSKIKIAARIAQHAADIPDALLKSTLAAVIAKFDSRHGDLVEQFRRRGVEVLPRVVATVPSDDSAAVAAAAATASNASGSATSSPASPSPPEPANLLSKESASKIIASPDRMALLGSYFMHEYSINCAALFNPSIVPLPQQRGGGGDLECVISLRACGEGHVSSIAFRRAIISGKDGSVQLVHPTYGPLNLGDAEEEGQTHERKQHLQDGDAAATTTKQQHKHRKLFWNPVTGHEFPIASDSFTVDFDPSVPLDRRVIFPAAPSQSNGIEDVRFVQFFNSSSDEETASATSGGEILYVGTYTAYNGREIFPSIITTHDFCHFKFEHLTGNAIANKGMALFPRKIKGRYWMLSRQDDENVMIMSSESLLRWDNPSVLMVPEQPWEMFKMGNCGSPIETPRGWLVLTHGVGPMRRYCIGAAFLDLEDPTKVIGRMAEPLIAPNEMEREGYVPNVVYSCGAMLHPATNSVTLPYAMSDSASSFASVPLEPLYKACGLLTSAESKI